MRTSNMSLARPYVTRSAVCHLTRQMQLAPSAARRAPRHWQRCAPVNKCRATTQRTLEHNLQPRRVVDCGSLLFVACCHAQSRHYTHSHYTTVKRYIAGSCNAFSRQASVSITLCQSRASHVIRVVMRRIILPVLRVTLRRDNPSGGCLPPHNKRSSSLRSGSLRTARCTKLVSRSRAKSAGCALVLLLCSALHCSRRYSQAYCSSRRGTGRACRDARCTSTLRSTGHAMRNLTTVTKLKFDTVLVPSLNHASSLYWSRKCNIASRRRYKWNVPKHNLFSLRGYLCPPTHPVIP